MLTVVENFFSLSLPDGKMCCSAKELQWDWRSFKRSLNWATRISFNSSRVRMSFWQELSLNHSDVGNGGFTNNFPLQPELKKNCWIFVWNIRSFHSVLMQTDSLLSFHLGQAGRLKLGLRHPFPLASVDLKRDLPAIQVSLFSIKCHFWTRTNLSFIYLFFLVA